MCGFSRPEGNVCFVWRTSRGHDPVTGHFEGFSGVLQSDAYQSYLKYEEDNKNVELAACWAHARRKFFEAKGNHPRECGIYLKLVAKLYKVETEIRELRQAGPDRFGDKEALEYRQKRSTLVHGQIHRLLKFLRLHCLPRSQLGSACDYSLKIWKQLSTYLEHGRVNIDNNLMENAIRPTAVGKKNWLFVGHPKAGDRSAIIYSILISCQRLEVDPKEYIESILDQNTAMMTTEELAALTPAEWKKSSKV